MSGIFSKVRVLALATTHDLLDKAVDMNSPSVLRQYIRDLETARAGVANENVNAGGTVRTYTREIAAWQAEQHTREEKIRLLLQSTDPHAPVVARAEATAVALLVQKITTDQTALADEQKLFDGLTEALSRIDAKHSQMVQQLNLITTTAASASAKEHAAAALDAAGRLAATGADVSVDNIMARMQHRNDVADEHFAQAMSSSDGLEDSETSSAADDVLARIKAESLVAAK